LVLLAIDADRIVRLNLNRGVGEGGGESVRD